MTVLPYETVFQTLVKAEPQLEFYAEIWNFGGTQEASPYIEVFYSAAENPKAEKAYIQYYKDPYGDDEEEEDEMDCGWPPQVSQEKIDRSYQAAFGQKREYFLKLIQKDHQQSMGFLPKPWYERLQEPRFVERYLTNITPQKIKEPEIIQRIESLQPGDRLQLQQPSQYSFAFCSQQGIVGYFNSDLSMVLSEMQQDGLQTDDVIITVNKVVPLSQKRKGSKYATLTVDVHFSDKVLAKRDELQKAAAANSFLDAPVEADTPALLDCLDAILAQAGFTFDGGAQTEDERWAFTAEKRLANFFRNIPVYHNPEVLGYLEVIVCNDKSNSKGFDTLYKVTDTQNHDGSVLYAQYIKKENQNIPQLQTLEQDAEKTLARFCKEYQHYRVYGCYGITPNGEATTGNKAFTQFFYSEAGEAACRIAQAPNLLQNQGGAALPIPDVVTDWEPPTQQHEIIMVNSRGSITKYDQ